MILKKRNPLLRPRELKGNFPLGFFFTFAFILTGKCEGGGWRKEGAMRSLRVFARRIKGGAAAPLDTAKTDLWKGRKEGGQNRSLNVQFTIDGINIDKPRLAEKMNSTFISRPNMQVEVSSPRSLIFVHLPQILYGSLFRTQRGEKKEVPCLVTVRRVGWTQRPEGAMSVWEKL